MWEEEIENLIRDRLDTSSTMTVAIVRGKRQLKLSRRGEHSGVATVNFANGGLSAAAEKLAARAIEELNGFAIAAVRSGSASLYCIWTCLTDSSACRRSALTGSAAECRGDYSSCSCAVARIVSDRRHVPFSLSFAA